MHFCDKTSKRILQDAVERCGWVVLHVDTTGSPISEAAYSYLVGLAQKGCLRGIVGSPPFRSFSGYHFIPPSEEGADAAVLDSPVRIRGQSIGCMEGLTLSGPEAVARQNDDVLVLRMLSLQAVAAAVNRSVGFSAPMFMMEQPEDQPESQLPSLWATPEWQGFAEEFDVQSISFDQGPLLHPRRRSTTLASTVMPSATLVDCRGPGIEAVQGITKGSFAGGVWAPGLVSAVAEMIRHGCHMDVKGKCSPGINALDAGFIEHLKQGHVPYRNDCQFCVRGSAKRKQHRRIMCPDSWSLSIDTAGPYKSGVSESGASMRYLVVGVLTVPVIALRDDDARFNGDRDDPAEEIGGALDDEEIFADGEDEPDEPLSVKELAEAKANRGAWDELIQRDQQSWKEEAEREYLPKVELVEWPFIEPIANKSQQSLLCAVRRMREEALNLGFEVRRIHTDRGREYNNNSLKAFCSQNSIVKTLAFAEEHQSNGRVESLIGRVKSKIRVFLEQGEASVEEWPLASRLVEAVLQNRAKRHLHMKEKPIVPYNTQVQVVQRAWRRGAWHSTTVSAKTKGPSSDNSRGWVVVTSDGNFLTTSKLFPSPDDHKKLVIRYEGDPIDPEAPDRRLRGKTAMRALDGAGLTEPRGEVEILAQRLLKRGDLTPKAVAQIALSLGKVPATTLGSAPAPVSIKEKGAIFFSGGYSFGGLTGMQNNTAEYPWTTTYLASYPRKHTSSPFAAVGLVWNAEHAAHRDSHNQKGIDNVVLPVVTSGGGLWVQDEGLKPEQRLSEEVKHEVKPGVQIGGRVISYKPGKPLTFNAGKWHASVEGSGQQLLLLGYTPRSLHKLSDNNRKQLWELGFTFLPATQHEYWTLDARRSLITRHHPVPRRPLYVPKSGDAPFSLQCLGNIRYCEQSFVDGNVSRHMHQWRHSRANLAVRAKWTGKSVFQFVEGSQACVDLGGGLPPNSLLNSCLCT